MNDEMKQYSEKELREMADKLLAEDDAAHGKAPAKSKKPRSGAAKKPAAKPKEVETAGKTPEEVLAALLEKGK